MGALVGAAWAGSGGDCDDDDCADCGGAALGAFLRCGTGTTRDGGGVDIFCLMSCSAASRVAIFWAICSCLTASCSIPRRTAARSRAISSSRGTNSEELAAADAV
jgi:hypothetical protein